MKYLVTGCAGLVGSHLCEELLKRGHIVYGIDNLSIGTIENIPKGVIFYEADLNSGSFVDGIFSIIRPDIVHHCACWAYEGLSQFCPRLVTENTYNIMLNVLVSSIKYKVKRFIQYSSMAVYGNQTPPFVEFMERKPTDVYGVAKAAAEQSLEILSQVHGIQYTILRPHNIIGEHQLVDPYRNVAMIFMNRIMQGKPPIIYGDGEQKRAFSYIKDAIPAMIRAEKIKSGKIINIGPTEEFTVNYLAEVILREFDSKLKPIHVADRPREVKNAWCSNYEARRSLGYKTKTTFEEAIHKMAVWAKKQGPREFKYLENLELEGNLVPKTWKDKLI